jgi:hypothetical protein
MPPPLARRENEPALLRAGPPSALAALDGTDLLGEGRKEEYSPWFPWRDGGAYELRPPFSPYPALCLAEEQDLERARMRQGQRGNHI